MRVIFMATPEFGILALKKLISAPNIEVIAVYTREPKKAGRGHKIVNSPIHQLAIENNLKVFTPKSFKCEKSQQEFIDLKADAALVVAYGLILPEAIIKSTKYGCVNIHPSILPKWRGATPIQSGLFAGDKKAGMSIILMDEGVDSGDVLLQQEFEIDDKDNFANLAPKLSKMGADMALEALYLLELGDAKPMKQDDFEASFSRKILKQDAKIDFNNDARKILNQIRALSGFMTAFFEINGEKIKIFEAEIVEDAKGEAGEILDGFVICCKNGAIRPLILQRQGKKPVALRDFLLGFKF